MKIWAKTKEWAEGKFLVVRRDGSVPHWPHFVLGARDPAAPGALRAYAYHAKRLGFEDEYCDSIMVLADDFEAYRVREGNGDRLRLASHGGPRLKRAGTGPRP